MTVSRTCADKIPRKLSASLLAAAAFGLFMARGDAQPLAAQSSLAKELTIHVIEEGKLYWAEGAGGNSGIIIGQNGVTVIDAKITAKAGAELVQAVGALTSKPITHVILTHSDGDHVNGLAGFPDGLKIIAHKNNVMELRAVYQFAAAEVGGGKCLPPENRLPNTIVFKDTVSTQINGDRFVLHHFGPAHTSGDLVVELPAHGIAFAGDLITNIVLVHPEKNGAFNGWFKTAEQLLKLNVRSYLGGHATALDTKESLRKRISGYQDIRGKVDRLVDEGMSLGSIKTAMGDPAQDPSGCRGIPYPSLANIEFNERRDLSSELK